MRMANIALVDDDENILTSVSLFLEGEGYQVQTFTDGVEALAVLADNPPDLAIFDIKMPRMDGLELLRRVRQSSNLPVIFLTSKDGEFDEALGLDLGADDYIAKPFSISFWPSASRRFCAAPSLMMPSWLQGKRTRRRWCADR